MKQLTVYELMGQDHLIYAHLENNNEITVQIVTDEDEETVFQETTSQFAWDSLVYFARQIVACDERVQLVRESRD
jgi:hypothetical protein